MSGTPIEWEVMPGSCGGGVCGDSVTLVSGERGLEEGNTYIVSVRASNRYGESAESGNSDTFSFGGRDSDSEGTCVFVCAADSSEVLLDYIPVVAHTSFASVSVCKPSS